MADRFVELFRLPSKLCFEGCPITIDAGTLLKDTADGRVLVQLKLCNISVQTVESCIVSITPYEPNGNVLEKYEYRFMDLGVPSWKTFGTREAIYLTHNIARKYDVCVIEVVLKNGIVWKGTDCKWNGVDSQQTIKDFLKDQDLESQYYIEVGKNAIFVPRYINGVYQCTCGVLNADGEEGCINCHRKYEAYKAALDVNFLKERIVIRKEKEAKLLVEQRLREEAEKRRREEEEKQRIEQEKQEQIAREIRLRELRIKQKASRKKALKVLLIVIPSVLIAIFLLLLTTVVLPIRKKISTYNEAEAYYLSGDYQSAIGLWEKVGNFSDSKKRIEEAKIAQDTAQKEEKYKEGMELLDNKKYSEAIIIFEAIQGYKDSNSKLEECRNGEQYQKASDLLAKEEYKESSEIFINIIDYKDSVDKYKMASYEYACKLAESDDLDNAITYFNRANGYKDANLRMEELAYDKAVKMLDQKQFEEAVQYFELCSGYKESDELILDAKFGYVNKHKRANVERTYIYLNDLITKKYPGAEAIYDELYGWNVTIMCLDNFPNSGSTCYKLGKDDTIYLRFIVKGGPPSGKEKISYIINRPGLNQINGSFEGTDAYMDAIVVPSGYRSGKCTIEFFDSKGNSIGSISTNLV